MDLIDRQAAIKAIKSIPDHDDIMRANSLGLAENAIRVLPSAQPDLSEYSDRLWQAAYEQGKAEAQQERKTGKWIPTGIQSPFGANVRCSACGESFATTELAEEIYCRHCGAYMGGNEDETD